MREEEPRPRAHDALPEGDEAPPDGVRTMALVRWALVGLMAAAASAAWLDWSGALPAIAAASGVADARRFHCPMHPAVVQDRAGECPICGMNLVRAGGRPAPAAAAASLPAAPAEGKYWCPMHPQVASDDPEAACEACGGMKLVPRDRAAAAAVPGLEPVELPARRTQLMGIRTARVERRVLSRTLRAVGSVSADGARAFVVASRTTGWIQELRIARTGERVERGQVLATIYGPELVTAQQAYLNALRWSGREGGGKAAGIDGEARRRLELLGIARQDVEGLARRGQVLDALPIRAPIAGHVSRKSAVAGGYVVPGSELLQIVDLSAVSVLAEVYEEDAQRVAVGQRARISVAPRPDRPLAGRVALVYPAVDRSSRTIRARIELDGPPQALRPGGNADVEIELAPAEGLALPSEALIDTGDRQYVFVASGGGRFEPRLVKVGERDAERVLAVEGLAEGEMVVTTANFLIDSESRMRAAVVAFRAPSTPHLEREPDEEEERHPRGAGEGEGRR